VIGTDGLLGAEVNLSVSVSVPSVAKSAVIAKFNEAVLLLMVKLPVRDAPPMSAELTPEIA
jgi:hypothetical protein